MVYPFHYRFDATVPERPTARQLASTLDMLVKTAKMTAFGPQQIRVMGLGWTAFQMIGESHIVITGIDTRGCAMIWSCKPFAVPDMAGALGLMLGGTWPAEEIVHKGYT